MTERLNDAVRTMMAATGMVGQFDIYQEGSMSHGFVGKPNDGEDMRVTVIVTPIHVSASISLTAEVREGEPKDGWRQFVIDTPRSKV
ncbi:MULTISPECIES: hypothetical protein [unclassified Novosphingobium]|uniref:hypothetical protein n=1 Tax=unclassified Novosphingobium TaxID=2644732 RepID=UPI0013577606|nr:MULTISPECIES: hypothetical protein [unclassified Novosphingobium]